MGGTRGLRAAPEGEVGSPFNPLPEGKQALVTLARSQNGPGDRACARELPPYRGRRGSEEMRRCFTPGAQGGKPPSMASVYQRQEGSGEQTLCWTEGAGHRVQQPLPNPPRWQSPRLADQTPDWSRGQQPAGPASPSFPPSCTNPRTSNWLSHSGRQQPARAAEPPSLSGRQAARMGGLGGLSSAQMGGYPDQFAINVHL